MDASVRAELDRLARSLGRQARVAMEQGDYPAAHRLQLERLGLNQRLDDDDGIATTLYEIGCVEVRLARLTDAANHLGESFDRFLESRRADGIAASGFQLGIVLAELGRPAEAMPAFAEARDAYGFLGQDSRVAEIDAILERHGVGEG